jgi:hypothetical protein
MQHDAVVEESLLRGGSSTNREIHLDAVISHGSVTCAVVSSVPNGWIH